ncbi:MAG: hypothetical protein HWD86_09860 [Kangiellaceae bacterium]|nr:hypothetical protein [Kangiellaceae bacterium]
MCVLIVPEKLLNDKEYAKRFEQYWQRQQKDNASLVEAERAQDRAFLEMVTGERKA